MPWFKNTLFVITSDHCAQSELKEYKTSVNYFAAPLIFFKGDGSLTGKNDSLAQQIDIMPSILGYLNYSKPYVAFGSNLFDPLAQRFAINYIEDTYQFLYGDHVIHYADNKLTGIFNWKSDPKLHDNLVGSGNYTTEQNLFKAVMQQFNNRMAQDRLTIETK